MTLELDPGDGDGVPKDYWKHTLLSALADMLCRAPEMPLGGASREEARMEQVSLPGLFALIEE